MSEFEVHKAKQCKGNAQKLIIFYFAQKNKNTELIVTQPHKKYHYELLKTVKILNFVLTFFHTNSIGKP